MDGSKKEDKSFFLPSSHFGKLSLSFKLFIRAVTAVQSLLLSLLPRDHMVPLSASPPLNHRHIVSKTQASPGLFEYLNISPSLSCHPVPIPSIPTCNLLLSLIRSFCLFFTLFLFHCGASATLRVCVCVCKREKARERQRQRGERASTTRDFLNPR